MTMLLTPLLVLSFAPPARADIGEAIILKCTHGESFSGYPQSAYAQALKEIEKLATVEEYEDCRNEISKAQRDAAGKSAGAGSSEGSGSGGFGGKSPLTQPERLELKHASHSAAAKSIQVGSHVIHPGVVHVDIASAVSSLPAPLFATLAFLLACALLLAGRALRNRVRSRQRS